jgi:UDP-N-acetylmuramate dehydrogenase
MHTSMAVEHGANLKAFNTFGLPCVAQTLVRITSDADVRRVVDDPVLGVDPKFVLGGGSNLVLTQDINACVLKIEVMGKRLLETRDDAWIIGAMEP